MIQTNPLPRLLGAGGGALVITAGIVFLMQALVPRGDLVLAEDHPRIDFKIWAEEDPGFKLPDRNNKLPEKKDVMEKPDIVVTGPTIGDPGSGPYVGPTRGQADKPDLSPVPFDRGAYPKFRVDHGWPSRALERGISGWVTIGFTISATGSVLDARVIESSHRMFEKHGLKAVSAYKYEPTIVNGRPVATTDQSINLVWEISE